MRFSHPVAAIAAIFFLTLLPKAAQAKEIVFMLNMNYSSAELAAVKEVAKKRGQSVVMVPPEKLIPQAEKLFAARADMEKKVTALRPNLKPGQLKTLVADFMLLGQASQKDPDLTMQLMGDAEDLHQQSMAMNAVEKNLGHVADQFRTQLQAFRKQGVHVDALILSAHSDGSNLSGETTNRLSSGDITRLHQEYPELFTDPRHVLLLGCYNMTETNHFRWRNNLFTNASLIGGFGVRAPSRYAPTGISYIKDVLNTADKLDSNLAVNGPLNPKLVEDTFKKFASVTNTLSVIDYCLQLVEGQPDARKLSCDEQWNTFRTEAKLVQANYLDLEDPKMDPPHEDTNTELRTFYSSLQQMCAADETTQIPPEQVKKAEAYRLTILGSLVRLIYWWNVQKNFKTYFAKEFSQFHDVLKELGVEEEMPPLEGETGRMEYVQTYNAIREQLKTRDAWVKGEKARLAGGGTTADIQRYKQRSQALARAQDLFKYFYPLYALESEDTVGDGEASDSESTLRRGGIPFHWIEAGAQLDSRNSQ